MIEILHDSHDEFYKSPFGAVACDAHVKFRLNVWSDKNISNVKLLIRKDGMSVEDFDMGFELEDKGVSTYAIDMKMPCSPFVVWYFFAVISEHETVYYGNNEEGLGGKGTKYQHKIPRPFQITVYKPTYNTPKWYWESIVYQIFVDRFFNGNVNGQISNPKPQSLIHANWNDTPFYVKDRRGDIVKWDFYGGNIKGIIKKLDYLKELGVGCIYMNPIFESVSNHKYDTGDYKKIDPMFGSEKDLEELCSLAQEKGINIVLDGVFSHTGSDSIYFNKKGSYDDLGAYQSENSKYYSWYKFEKHPDEYKGWWGVKSLPEVNEMEETYTDFIIWDEDSVISHWMKKGVRGWRLDVADELPDEFIEQLRSRIKSIDEEAVIIGEVWEDASNKISYGRRRNYFSGLELDGVMNYPFRKILSEYIMGYISSEQAGRRFWSMYENYPKQAFYSNLNVIGSHDVIRILTILGEAPDEKGLGDFEKYTFKLSKENRSLAMKRLKLMSLVQMTFPGVPCIYYGDEAGLEGYSDPFNRAAFPWGLEEKELLNWYKKMAHIRNTNDALKRGSWRLIESCSDIFAFARTVNEGDSKCGEGDVIMVAVNRNKNEKAVLNAQIREIVNEKECEYEDLITGNRHKTICGVIVLEIEELGAVILKNIN